MDDLDKKNFKLIFDDLCDFYQRKEMTPSTLRLYFSALSDMTIEDLRFAVESHIKNKKSGKYFPKAADLISSHESDFLSDIGDLSWVTGEALEPAKVWHLKKYGFYRIGKQIFRAENFQNNNAFSAG